MARKGKSKKIYLIAILIYLFSLVISLLICFFVKAQYYVYILTVFGVTILFLVLFFITCYEKLYKVNPNDIDEVKKITIKTDEVILNERFRQNGFEHISKEQIFYKTFTDIKKKNKFHRYIFITKSDYFDLSLEKFLLTIQNTETVNKSEYYEAYIILLTETTEFMTELYKESRANNYIFPNVSLAISDKLFKCLILNQREETLYYYKINIYPKSLDAVNFIEKDIAKIISG